MATKKNKLKGELLHMGKWHKAYGMLTKEGFVVLKGSWINPTTSKSCLKGVAKLRKEYASKINGNKLISDIRFGSSSYAAGFVMGSSTNGKLSWRNADGKTLRELEK